MKAERLKVHLRLILDMAWNEDLTAKEFREYVRNLKKHIYPKNTLK